MPTFNFVPMTSTPVTVMSTLPIAFTALVKPTPSKSITLPSGSVFNVDSLSVRDDDDDDCDSDDGEDDEGSKTPPGQGGTPPGQAKKACRTSTSSAALASTSTTTSNLQSPTQTTVPSIQPASPSLGVTASRPTQDSSATTTDGSSGSTDSRSPGSQESTTGSSTSASSSTSTSSPSIPPAASSGSSSASASGTPAANLSTPSPPTTSSFSSATAPPAGDHDLSVASAVGIALGVFAVTAILVAGAVALFLLLRRRRRKRRRRRDDSASERKLASSEGAPSRPLSSTWSWFGSIAVGTEPEHDPDTNPDYAYKYGRRASSSPYPHDADFDDPFHGPGVGSEKGAAVRDPTASPVGVHEVEVEHARVLACPEPDFSALNLSLSLSASSSPAGVRAAAVCTLDGCWDLPKPDGVDDEEQGAHDPFQDPVLSMTSDASIIDNSVEVESLKVR